MKTLISKKQAEVFIESAVAKTSAPKARRIKMPNRPGETAHVGPMVDLTKIRNPNRKNPVKFRYALVGSQREIDLLLKN